MIKWPKELAVDIGRRNCVIYVGSGISANSIGLNGEVPPTWKEFLLGILVKVNDAKALKSIKKLIKENDYLTATEIIISKIGMSEFTDYCHDKFRRPGYKPTDIHATIYNLDSRIVISPNVDKIYDQYALSTSAGSVLIK